MGTYTANVRLYKPGQGEPDWGPNVNNDFDLIDAAIGDIRATIDDLPAVYIYSGLYEGSSGVSIPLPITVASTSDYGIAVVSITGNQDINDIIVEKSVDSFKIKNSADNSTDSYQAIVYYKGDQNAYGMCSFREWIVSIDPSITDHGNAATFGSIAWCIAQAGGNICNVRMPGTHTYFVQTNLTIPLNITLKPDRGAIIDLGTYGADLTILGKFDPEGGISQYFDTDTTTRVTFADGSIDAAYPDWFGAEPDGASDCTFGIQCAIESNDFVRLTKGTYFITDTLEPNTDTRIDGIGVNATAICMDWSAIGGPYPVFTMDATNHVSVNEMRIYYDSLPYTTDTTAVAFYFTNSCGWFSSRNIQVDTVYSLLDVNDTAGSFMFNSEWNNTRVRNFSRYGLDAYKTNGVVGSGNLFNNLYLNNYWGGSNQGAYMVMRLGNFDGVFNQLNIEHTAVSSSYTVSMTSCKYVVINGLWMEDIEMVSNPSILIFTTGADVRAYVTGLRIYGLTISSGASNFNIFACQNASGGLWANGVYIADNNTLNHTGFWNLCYIYNTMTSIDACIWISNVINDDTVYGSFDYEYRFQDQTLTPHVVRGYNNSVKLPTPDVYHGGNANDYFPEDCLVYGETTINTGYGEGVHVRRNDYWKPAEPNIFGCTYDFSVHGGATGIHSLSATIPKNSYIVEAWYEVKEALVPSGTMVGFLNRVYLGGLWHTTCIADSGTVAVCGSPAATYAFSTGLHQGTPDGTIANFSNISPTTWRNVTLAIQSSGSTSELTAGKIKVWGRYITSE